MKISQANQKSMTYCLFFFIMKKCVWHACVLACVRAHARTYAHTRTAFRKSALRRFYNKVVSRKPQEIDQSQSNVKRIFDYDWL